ncbi:MAG: DUF2975 domain-containing protein [Gemmatimonadaceae bacterium]
MSNSYPDALKLSRSVLNALIALNLVMGLLILFMLIGSLVAETWVMTALGAAHPGRAPTLYLGMRVIMVIGIGAVPLAHVVLTRLRAIVETVRLGDPFVAENTERLQVIAWMVLGLELLHVAVGAIARAVSTTAQPLDIDWNFSVTRWLAVLLLFVLARVFEHGTRMREELQATV